MSTLFHFDVNGGVVAIPGVRSVRLVDGGAALA